MRRIIQVIFLGFMAVMLAACAAKVEKNNFADLTFGHIDPIKLDIADIQIKKAYQPTMSEPYVDHEMPISLMETAVRWANDVVQATGTSGSAIITISEASVVEEILSKKDGITGTFTTEQSERYTSKLSIEIKVMDTSGAAANTNATVSRSMTVAEDIKLIDREKVWFSLVEKTTKDMNSKMQENTKKFLSSYISK